MLIWQWGFQTQVFSPGGRQRLLWPYPVPSPRTWNPTQVVSALLLHAKKLAQIWIEPKALLTWGKGLGICHGIKDLMIPRCLLCPMGYGSDSFGAVLPWSGNSPGLGYHECPRRIYSLAFWNSDLNVWYWGSNAAMNNFTQAVPITKSEPDWKLPS